MPLVPPATTTRCPAIRGPTIGRPAGCLPAFCRPVTCSRAIRWPVICSAVPASLRHLHDRLPSHLAPQQCRRGLGGLLPRPTPADLRVELARGHEPDNERQIRAETRTHDESLDAAPAAQPGLLEVDRGRLERRHPDALHAAIRLE